MVNGSDLEIFFGKEKIVTWEEESLTVSELKDQENRNGEEVLVTEETSHKYRIKNKGGFRRQWDGRSSSDGDVGWVVGVGKFMKEFYVFVFKTDQILIFRFFYFK